MNKRVTSLMLVAALAGCTHMNNQDVGSVGGGVIGGLVGSRFGKGSGQAVATSVGVLMGTIIGGRIGQSMDEVDRQQIQYTLENYKVGRSRKWENPDTHVHYMVKPTKTYYRHHGSQPCRKFVAEATIDGKKERVFGKACRLSDGTWQIKTH